jgi:hypothetical protein
MDKRVLIGVGVAFVAIAIGYAWQKGYLAQYLPAKAKFSPVSADALAAFAPTPAFASAVRMAVTAQDYARALGIVGLEMVPRVVTSADMAMRVDKTGGSLTSAVQNATGPIVEVYGSLGVPANALQALAGRALADATAVVKRQQAAPAQPDSYSLALSNYLYPSLALFPARFYKQSQEAQNIVAAQAVGLAAWWGAAFGGSPAYNAREAAAVAKKFGAGAAQMDAAASAVGAAAPGLLKSGKSVEQQMLTITSIAMAAASSAQ